MLCDETSKIKALKIFKGLQMALLAGGKVQAGKIHVMVNVFISVCFCLLCFVRATQHDSAR